MIKMSLIEDNDGGFLGNMAIQKMEEQNNFEKLSSPNTVSYIENVEFARVD